MTSGLLGHGLSVGVGMALGQRIREPRHHTYVLLGDGDIQSGLTWEGALVAAKYCTWELTAIVDYNDVTNDGAAHNILPFEPLIDKWRAFGFTTCEINGHNLRQVLDALDTALEIHNRPTVIIAHTTKGKGVSFMENTSEWHGKIPSAEQYARAQVELSGE